MNDFEPEPRHNLDPFTSHLPLPEDPNLMLTLLEQKYGAVYFLNKQWPLEGVQLLLVRRSNLASSQLLSGSFLFKKQILCRHVQQVIKLRETFCMINLMFNSLINRDEVVANCLAKLDRECLHFLQYTAPSVLAFMRAEIFAVHHGRRQ